MDKITVGFRYLHPDDRDLDPPSAMTKGASGVDLSAANRQEIVIRPGETAAIPTGMQLEIPEGYECQVRPRSGLALNHGVGILNSPGTIDSDYRGEIRVILTNFGKEVFTVRRGDRIAQLVFQRVVKAEFVAKDTIENTNRGFGGFGHTGK
jgi:dUTP pyrophosphatase